MKKLCAVVLAMLFAGMAFAGDSWDSAMSEGTQKYKKRKYAEAVAAYDQAFKLASDNKQKADTVIKKSVCLARMRKYPEVLESVNAIINDFPPESGMRFELDKKKIDAYSRIRKAPAFRKLLKDFSPAYIKTVASQNQYYYYFWRGLACYRLGQYIKAGREMDICLKLRPGYKGALYYKGRVEDIINLHKFQPQYRRHQENNI